MVACSARKYEAGAELPRMSGVCPAEVGSGVRKMSGSGCKAFPLDGRNRAAITTTTTPTGGRRSPGVVTRGTRAMDSNSKVYNSNEIDDILERSGVRNFDGTTSVSDQEKAFRFLAGVSVQLDAIALSLLRGQLIAMLKEKGIQSPASIADAVLARAPEAKAGNASGATLREPKPWPEAVSGAELLDAVLATIRRHIVLPEHADVAVALWVAHTYVYEVFRYTPRLAVTSPVKQCGKTTLLKLVEFLTPRPLSASTITAAALFRGVSKWRPVVLIDEADTFLSERRDLQGVINAGFERGGDRNSVLGRRARANDVRCVCTRLHRHDWQAQPYERGPVHRGATKTEGAWRLRTEAEARATCRRGDLGSQMCSVGG